MKIDWHIIITPAAWFSNYPTNWHWDDVMLDMLHYYNPIRRDEFTVELGPYRIWVENWPYAYGAPVDNYSGQKANFLPSVLARKILKKKLMEHDSAGSCKKLSVKHLSDFSYYKNF